MAKTYNEYLADEQFKDELLPVREVYAMRMVVQDEIAGMGTDEITEYFHRNACTLSYGGVDKSAMKNT